MTTIREFIDDNATMVRQIAREHGLSDPDAIAIVDMSLAYDLAHRQAEDNALIDLLTKLDAIDTTEETND